MCFFRTLPCGWLLRGLLNQTPSFLLLAANGERPWEPFLSLFACLFASSHNFSRINSNAWRQLGVSLEGWKPPKPMSAKASPGVGVRVPRLLDKTYSSDGK